LQFPWQLAGEHRRYNQRSFAVNLSPFDTILPAPNKNGFFRFSSD
jgi:hypothetical protein